MNTLFEQYGGFAKISMAALQKSAASYRLSMTKFWSHRTCSRIS